MRPGSRSTTTSGSRCSARRSSRRSASTSCSEPQPPTVTALASCGRRENIPQLDATRTPGKNVAVRPTSLALAAAAKTSTVVHRVPFYETDAMGVVHHANYVRYLELARIVWMDEHDRPYREYVAEGLHFATTMVNMRFLRPAQFDDLVEITTWLDWVRRATLRMG